MKWMSIEYQKKCGYESVMSTEFKNLGKEYQDLKKENLAKFIRKLSDFYPKSNESEKIIIGFLEPMIGYSHSSGADEVEKFLNNLSLKVEGYKGSTKFGRVLFELGTPWSLSLFNNEFFEDDGFENDDEETDVEEEKPVSILSKKDLKAANEMVKFGKEVIKVLNDGTNVPDSDGNPDSE